MGIFREPIPLQLVQSPVLKCNRKRGATMRLPKQSKPIMRVHVPFEMKEDVGLGDAIKRFTSKVGINPCGGCKRRAKTLNNYVVFTGRRK